ncbi:MAG: antibiotic biosynthesis monooxygenase [Cognatishimia sp.]|uniref:putative quinol monooxygenase n=1 Tax=Cognatishimia sp. TaxID=2211648 RepID=UPI003B8CFDDE
MLIAHVEFQITPSDRDAALDVLLKETAVVRAMSGNLKFQAFKNPEHDDRIEIMHEWDSKEAFEAYLSSKSFASIGQILGPKMIAPPLSKRFLANPVAD